MRINDHNPTAQQIEGLMKLIKDNDAQSFSSRAMLEKHAPELE